MKLRALAVSLLALSACSKSKPGEPDKAAANAPAAPVPPPEPKVEDAPPIPAPTARFACHAKDPAAPMAKRKPATPWQLPFVFAGCPDVPSEIYGTAALGMDAAAAAKAAPKAKIEDEAAYIYLGKAPFRYQFTFRFDEKTKKLDKFGFRIDAEGFEELKAGWGEPLIYTRLGDSYNAWLNPEKHLKVTALADTWNRTSPTTKEYEDVPGYHVYIQSYLPLAELVGKDGLLAKSIIGKTVDELATAYPDWIDIKSKDQNTADMNRVGLDKATQDKVRAMGAGGDTAMLQLPETETNVYHSLVQPDWENGKVASWTLLLPFGKDKALKQELLAIVAAALGKPVTAKKDGEDWEYTFAGPNNTIVEMGMSTLAEDWNLRVSPKK
jgi:hypothetical protein